MLSLCRFTGVSFVLILIIVVCYVDEILKMFFIFNVQSVYILERNSAFFYNILHFFSPAAGKIEMTLCPLLVGVNRKQTLHTHDNRHHRLMFERISPPTSVGLFDFWFQVFFFF